MQQSLILSSSRNYICLKVLHSKLSGFLVSPKIYLRYICKPTGEGKLLAIRPVQTQKLLDLAAWIVKDSKYCHCSVCLRIFCKLCASLQLQEIQVENILAACTYIGAYTQSRHFMFCKHVCLFATLCRLCVHLYVYVRVHVCVCVCVCRLVCVCKKHLTWRAQTASNAQIERSYIPFCKLLHSSGSAFDHKLGRLKLKRTNFAFT